MMKKLTVILLALTLLLSLTACEDAISKLLYKSGGDSGEPVQAQEPAIPDAAPSGGDAPTAPIESTDPTVPEEPVATQPEPDAKAEPDVKDEPEAGRTVMASHTDVSLFSAGETFRFTVWDSNGNDPDVCTYTSADPAVAAVDETGGEITAVAPGITTVTAHVEYGGEKQEFECIVRCRWSAEEPDLPGTDPAADPDTSSSEPTLSEFFSTLQGEYEGLGAMMVLDTQLLDSYYPGLTGIAAVEEMLIQESMISTANMAVGLVRLSESATQEDVLAVQSILQSRITTQADGGAFYPASCETWKNGVITSASNCVGMFVYPDDAYSMATLFTDTFGN